MTTAALRSFRPLGNNKTVSVVVTASVQSLPIPDSLGTRSLRIVNSGSAIVFLEFVQAGQTATTTSSMPMLPNTVETFTFAVDQSSISVIGATTGSTLYITYGEGL